MTVALITVEGNNNMVAEGVGPFRDLITFQYHPMQCQRK
jgi:hypothetical protein